MPPLGSRLFDGRLWIPTTGRRERGTEAQEVGQSQEPGRGGGGGGEGEGRGRGSLLATLGTEATVTAIGCLMVSMLRAVPDTPTCVASVNLLIPWLSVTDGETEAQRSGLTDSRPSASHQQIQDEPCHTDVVGPRFLMVSECTCGSLNSWGREEQNVVSILGEETPGSEEQGH